MGSDVSFAQLPDRSSTLPQARVNQTLSRSDNRNGGPGNTIWADGILYGFVVTPATFKDNHDNYDKLYAGAVFRDAVELISESKRGDRDYGGGKREFHILKPGADPT